MIDPEKVGDFFARSSDIKCGWFTPDGGVIGGKMMYDHFMLLSTHSPYENLFHVLDYYESKESSASDDFRDQYRRESHTPWHVYDSQWDDEIGITKCFIKDVAYLDGFIRFYLDHHRNKFSVEGTETVINENQSRLRSIARDLGCELEIHVANSLNSLQQYFPDLPSSILMEDEMGWYSDLCKDLENIRKRLEEKS